MRVQPTTILSPSAPCFLSSTLEVRTPSSHSDGRPKTKTKNDIGTTLAHRQPLRMCWIPRSIYTVCAHVRVGELIFCEAQKARNEELLRQDGCWANLSLTLRSCQPGTPTRLKYWFCDDCRGYFKDYETDSRDAVLKYWAFKSAHGYSSSIAPMLAPPDLVFGSTAPVVEDPKQCRYEVISLAKEVPRELFETSVEWLQRLETVRTLTLELAETRSHTTTDPQVQTCETARDVINAQPRITKPMSVYPFADALRPSTEDTEISLQSPGVPREPPQLHAETFRKLCGELAEDEPQHLAVALQSLALSAVHDEVRQGLSDEAFGAAGAAPPPSVDPSSPDL